MAARKIAISVPQEVLKSVDRLARKTGTTRSGFISRVLKDVSLAQSRAEITARIDALFADGSINDEQRSTATAFLRAAESEGEGTEW